MRCGVISGLGGTVGPLHRADLYHEDYEISMGIDGGYF